MRDVLPLLQFDQTVCRLDLDRIPLRLINMDTSEICDDLMGSFVLHS